MLSNEERLEFESHIDECECCNIKFRNLKIIVESANEIKEIDLPINFSSELKANLEKEKANQNQNMILNKKKILNCIVAGLFIIITSVSLLNNSSIYKNKNNLISEIDQMSEMQENITFDITSEESKEVHDRAEKESIEEQRVMTIRNADENQDFNNQLTENKSNKTMNLFILVAIIVSTVILIYKKFKR